MSGVSVSVFFMFAHPEVLWPPEANIGGIFGTRKIKERTIRTVTSRHWRTRTPGTDSWTCGCRYPIPLGVGRLNVAGQLVRMVLFPASVKFKYNDQLPIVYGVMSIYAPWIGRAVQFMTWVENFMTWIGLQDKWALFKNIVLCAIYCSDWIVFFCVFFQVQPSVKHNFGLRSPLSWWFFWFGQTLAPWWLHTSQSAGRT